VEDEPQAVSARETARALEAGRLLFAQGCDFVAGAADAAALPKASLPEVAFAGRSNVGKSSLINALTGRKALARVSHTPGRTQQINFFDLGQRLMLVDLPGYGYAAVGRKTVGAWSVLIQAYLKHRPNLRRLCLLIDSRHGVKDSDRETMEGLDRAALSYQLVLTKADEVNAAELEKHRAAAVAEAARHRAAHPEVIVTSSFEGSGIPELRGELASLSRPHPLR
jgi:GTP-binding protein